MNLEWDGKIGPASVIGLIGSLTVLITMGVVWGQTTSKIDEASRKAADARNAATELARLSEKREAKSAQQSERLGKIETSIQFIVPALQRIETKLDAVKQDGPVNR